MSGPEQFGVEQCDRDRAVEILAPATAGRQSLRLMSIKAGFLDDDPLVQECARRRLCTCVPCRSGLTHIMPCLARR